MLTNIWGPSLWESIHHIAAGYSTQPTLKEKQAMSSFIYNLPNVLPCSECQFHFKQLLSNFPPDLTNSCTLTNWAYKAHNMVNARLGKPQFSVDDFQKKYAGAIKAHHERKRLGL